MCDETTTMTNVSKSSTTHWTVHQGDRPKLQFKDFVQMLDQKLKAKSLQPETFDADLLERLKHSEDSFTIPKLPKIENMPTMLSNTNK